MTLEHKPENTHIFAPEEITQPAKRGAWKWMLPLSTLLIAVVFAAWHFGWHAKAVTTGVLLFATASHVLAWVLGIITLVPIVGPLIVKVLSLSIIWLLNAVGYLVSYVAIKRGYSKDVLTYRAVTIALITGIVIGFVLGSIV
ncbi:hypothetical protein [Methylotenera sp.]|uniref:hypothetical protein n=1 Tax=Methylotenera sp. TaxID=2051956 RepID=UPI00271F3CC3|nr:hypothetical protein [Methylotenera sp.]MDO9205658.1 hypothetical protein [Methylotenera sp.]MDO9394641.1 hypothetical protein [Methylotenera sp.]MDP1522608.1 hypothetical protein [Methylotenera sp.]MDP2070416.1 hypothetical protein [Methylotenera sp.]MDP2230191.1 hypothetical protein [Methylotenera sp.]